MNQCFSVLYLICYGSGIGQTLNLWEFGEYYANQTEKVWPPMNFAATDVRFNIFARFLYFIPMLMLIQSTKSK